MTTPLDGSLLDAVRDLAAVAAGRILDIYRSPFEVVRKADASPLTEADLASHRTILAGLNDLAPDIPVLSEESADIDFATRSGWSRYWLVDPLDGTKDFVNGNGEFTVNIALIERHAPVLGVVAVPVTGVAYVAVRGLGALTAIGRRTNSSALSARARRSRSGAPSSSAFSPKERSTSTRASDRPANGIRPPRKSWWSRPGDR